MTHSKTRGILIAGNWKMNHTIQETRVFFEALRSASEASFHADTRDHLQKGLLQACLAPPYLSLATAQELSQSVGFPLRIAAQNAHWEEKGAFTGEVSAAMLKEQGIHCAIIGHSERRQIFGETDESVRKRGEHLLDQGFRIILCIGETQQERTSGRTEKVLEQQLHGTLLSLDHGIAKYLPTGKVILAYEPVWAIGTGVTATTEQAEEVHRMLRKFLWDRFGMEASGRTPILYGGSVTPQNLAELLKCPNVDGALVGGGSLKPEQYFSLLQIASEALR